MLNYKVYMNKNKKNLKTYNKFYARAVYLGTTELAGMADKIQANCSVKKSDVLAVLTELKRGNDYRNSVLKDCKDRRTRLI